MEPSDSYFHNLVHTEIPKMTTFSPLNWFEPVSIFREKDYPEWTHNQLFSLANYPTEVVEPEICFSNCTPWRTSYATAQKTFWPIITSKSGITLLFSTLTLPAGRLTSPQARDVSVSKQPDFSALTVLPDIRLDRLERNLCKIRVEIANGRILFSTILQ